MDALWNFGMTGMLGTPDMLSVHKRDKRVVRNQANIEEKDLHFLLKQRVQTPVGEQRNHRIVGI